MTDGDEHQDGDAITNKGDIFAATRTDIMFLPSADTNDDDILPEESCVTANDRIS
eukprot:CAMPEP_0172509192 /NCGR_PEP_ID=MMETSP1066-20121228/218258_1 /TAXON_ID=671091 /ORGANISM="Coscinodiscus wailesii, Strain CCMP2513" /LENGTH=54 /DNA_ID=CAMNT_0013287565 /DNA_START=1 /DNA_END=162 /DNA_ORIENTATION=+